MNQLLIFAGTTEGRELSAYFTAQGFEVTICVATEYGEELVEKSDKIKVIVCRMDQVQMQNLMRTRNYKAVIDATHPYAEVVSKNIKNACAETDLEYIRVVRQSTNIQNCIDVESAEEAVSYLKSTQGNILLTTGSKDLKIYTNILGYEQRIYPRILPMADGLHKCLELGYKSKNIICMQGPFSEEMNTAMLRQIDAKYLVTKDTGNAGGFAEKLAAANAAGVQTVVIGRPTKEDGLSMQQVITYIMKKFKN